MRLSEAIDALCIATRADGRSPRTVGSYRQKLKPLLAFLGDVHVEEISIDDLRRYVAHLMDLQARYVDHPTRRQREGGLSPFTVSSRIRAFKRLFNWLAEEGAIEGNPARRIKIPRPRREEPKGVDLQDVVAMVATTKAGSLTDLRDRALLLFLTDTGCRVGGLCGLRVEDVDLVAHRATVMEKRGKARFIFFTPATAEALAAWLEVRPQDRGPWVFVGLASRSKGPMSANSVFQALRQRAERAGVAGPVNPHAFRHGFARHFLLDGGDLGTLSDLMGHADVSVTKEYYAIFTAEELQEKHRQHSPVARILGGGENGNQ
ncbi:MAG: tyrosine-type recombinase/integrase [Anaerolineae bacterium]|nr:tyrosine-type recombinase/integrase [Anaerolineae bacterium]